MITKLSILVPVFNELPTLELVLTRITGLSLPIDHEVIVVDDGSTDGSEKVLCRWSESGRIRLHSHFTNQGKGCAIQSALCMAHGDVAVVQDADLELDPGDLAGLLQPILRDEAKICFGSRFAFPSTPPLRFSLCYWANRILNGLNNRMHGLRLTDFNTGYKMMTTELWRRLDLRERGFAIECEITGKLARMGCIIHERPVLYTPRRAREGKKIRAFDFLRYLAAIARYRFLRTPTTSAGASSSVEASSHVARSARHPLGIEVPRNETRHRTIPVVEPATV